jgi:TM2 domain-containing membrane protein YozV
VAEQYDGQIRVGTVEREAAMNALSKHLETGHLEVDEYTQRMDRAATARTVAELDELFVDLPAPHYRPPAEVQPQPPGLSTAPFVHPSMHVYDVNRPLSHKSKLAAGLLQILLPFGIGRFYTGHIGIAVAQLLLSVLWIGIIWSIIDGVLILAQGGTDRQGLQLRN